MKCDVCNKEVPKTNYFSINNLHVCGKHYAQYRKYNKFLDKSPKIVFDINEFKIEGNIATIYTINKHCDVSGFFIIDSEDLDRVITRKWRLWKNRFFTGVEKPLSISNFILNEVEKDEVIDHINHNPADNRKSNLRIITQQQNVCNQTLKSTNNSGFAGIYFDKSRDKWCAEIKSNYIKCFLGRYTELEDACFVRHYAEQQIFTEFRNTNNDKNLLPIANKCNRKEELQKHVNKRILEKFSLCK